MKFIGAELFDGLQCGECAWSGPLEEASDINGLACGNYLCRSANVVEIHLCRTCKADPEWFDGQCISCHRHVYEDGECGCGAILRRDQIQEVKPLIKGAA